MDDLTAVIVTHNSSGALRRCVDAVLRWTSRVVVVDNASSDSTRTETGPAALIVNVTNRGFAAAANQGFQVAATQYVLLLNPDVEVEDGRDALLAAASNGAATGLLVGRDGQPQTGFALRRFPTPLALTLECLGFNRLFPQNPVNRRYRCLDVDLSHEQEAEQPPGAFLMVRRDAWESVGGFDEGFTPVWFEDVDFCLRLRQGGWRIRYTPAARARHEGGHSIRQMSAGEKQIQWYVSLLRYAGKHFGAGGYHAVCLSVALSSFPRAWWGVFRTGRVENLAIGWQIIKEALQRSAEPRVCFRADGAGSPKHLRETD